jgi:trehalose utilization protein
LNQKMGSKLRITVWGEYVHERKNAVVAEIYPNGMHQCIANGLSGDKTLDVRTATLDQPNHGLTEAVLDSTDVLLWWGHAAHGQVTDLVADAVVRRVWEGMGLIALHSGHYSKVFKRLMGTSCSLTWREAGEKERLWVCNPGHPIAHGLDRYFEIPNTETFQSIRLASRSLRKARVFIRPARKAISENRGSHSHTRLI